MALVVPKAKVSGAASAQTAQTPSDLAAALGVVSSHDPNQQAGLKVCLWGDYGSLKTTYLLSFPGVFILNFDPQASTIQGQPFRVPYIQIRDYKHMLEVEKFVTARRMSELAQAVGFDGYKVQTIGVDSSTFQGHMIAAECDRSDHTTKSGAFDGQKWYLDKLKLHNRWLMAMGDASKVLPGKEHYNIVTTAHEKIHYDEKGNIKAISAAIDGDAKTRIFGTQDINLYCEKVDNINEATGKVIQNTRPTPKVYTAPHTKWHRPVLDRIGIGGRYNVLPRTIEPPPLSEGGLWGELKRLWGME